MRALNEKPGGQRSTVRQNFVLSVTGTRKASGRLPLRNSPAAGETAALNARSVAFGDCGAKAGANCALTATDNSVDYWTLSAVDAPVYRRARRYRDGRRRLIQYESTIRLSP